MSREKSTGGVGNEYVVIYFTLTWKHFKTEILVWFRCSLQHFYSFLFSCLFLVQSLPKTPGSLNVLDLVSWGSVKENFLSDRSWALFCFFDIPYFLE